MMEKFIFGKISPINSLPSLDMTCLKSPPAAEMNDKARENHSPALCVCYIF